MALRTEACKPLEFPAACRREFFDRINSATQGKAEVKDFMRRIVLPGRADLGEANQGRERLHPGRQVLLEDTGLYENQDREVSHWRALVAAHRRHCCRDDSESRNKFYAVRPFILKRSILVSTSSTGTSSMYGDVIEAAIKDIEGNKTIILEPKLLKGGMLLR